MARTPTPRSATCLPARRRWPSTKRSCSAPARRISRSAWPTPPGIQTVSMGTNGSQFYGWGVVLNAVSELEQANAGTVSAMVMAPRTAREIYKLVDNTGQPLQPPPRIAGVPMLTTTAAPVNETEGTANNASSIILGDFSNVFVGLRTSLQVSVLNERYADSGQVGFVSWLRADVLVSRPAAMARVTGIVPV